MRHAGPRCAERMGERILDRRFNDIMVQGLTTDYREGKVVTCQDSKMGLEDI